jgi:hypothetical protein
MGYSRRASTDTTTCSRAASRAAILTTVALSVVLCARLDRPARAAPPPGRHESFEATTSDAARQDAVKLIPMDRMAAAERAKVASVLSNVSVFRRLPVKAIDCDPDLYLFLVRHPDVVVNIWDVLKLSKLQLQQTDDNRFQVIESGGTTASLEFLYRSHNLHVAYGEGSYHGTVLARPVKGRTLLVLKTGYVRETNNRYYVTSRLDCFLSIDPSAVELFTRTVAPLLGKTADNNLLQVEGFASSLSRTAEVNSRGVRRLAMALSDVRPEVRDRFAEIAAGVPHRLAEARASGDSKVAVLPKVER